MASRHSLIVGGTRGLGREFVRFFRSKGHAVSIVSRNHVAVATKGVFHAAADIRNEGEFLSALDQCRRKNGPFDNLFLTQRFRGDGAWDGEMAVTVDGMRIAVDFVKDHFKPKGSKSIIAISSVAGRYYIDDQPLAYHIGKAALEQMIRYYAVTLGPSGVRVNGITPCAFVKEESRKFYANNKEIQKFYKTVAPLGRLATTRDIAELAGFLADPACYLTGQTILMDGGISLLWPEAAAKRIDNPFARAKKN